METQLFLKSGHQTELPGLNKREFTSDMLVSIDDLWANQPTLDEETLNIKLKGKKLSACYVVGFNGKKILIDGHHTVIAKKLNGQNKLWVKFLDLNQKETITNQNNH